MHHAPAGPPFVARVAGLLARARYRAAVVLRPLLTLVVVVRRTRLVPVVVAGLVLGSFALTAPLTPAVDDTRDTAVLVAPTQGARALVPATGDGWTQDGVPAATSSDRASRSVGGSSSASASSSAPGAASERADGAPSAAQTPAASARAASGSPADGAPSEKPSSGEHSSRELSSARAPAPPAGSASRSSTSERPSPTAAEEAPAAGGLEAEVLALVNAERAAAGCAAVVTDPQLAAVARAHSEDMRDRGFFDHVDPDGIGPFDRAERAGVTSAGAENIAQGQAGADAVMAAWMGSSGHRADILDCELRTLGVGVATGAGGPWWTQLFGV